MFGTLVFLFLAVYAIHLFGGVYLYSPKVYKNYPGPLWFKTLYWRFSTPVVLAVGSLIGIGLGALLGVLPAGLGIALSLVGLGYFGFLAVKVVGAILR